MTVTIANLTSTWIDSNTVYDGIGLDVTGFSYDVNSKIFRLAFNSQDVFSILANGNQVLANNTTLSNTVIYTKNAYDLVNVSFTQSNNEVIRLTGSYIKINSAYAVINAAYTQANTLTTSSNAYALSIGAAGNAYASSVGASSNAYSAATYSTLTQFGSLFGVANASFGVSNGAFGIANVGFGVANAGFNKANSVAISANSYASAVGQAANAYAASITASYTGALSSTQITGALGYTPYNATNPSGYITSSALSPYAPLASPTLTGTTNISKLITSNRIVLPSSNDGRTNGLWHWGDSDSNWVTYMAQPTVGTNPAGTTMAGGYWDNGHQVRVRAGAWGFEDYVGNVCRAHINGTGAWFANQIRSPVFYDSDNTGYYCDPNSVSFGFENRTRWRQLIGFQSYDGCLYDGDENHRPGICIKGSYPKIDIMSSGINNTNHGPALRLAAFDTANATSGNFKQWIIGTMGTDAVSLGFGYSAGTDANPHIAYSRNFGNVMWFQNDLNVYVNNDIRSPIFYDRNNTGYYVNPDGGSVFVSHTVRNLYFTGVGGNSGAAADGYSLYQEPGAWNHPYPDLVIGWHTGIKIGGYFGYNGTRFYNNNPANGSLIASIGDGDSALRSYDNVIAYASDRRLKENIVNISNAIEKIMTLNGVTFDWKDMVKDLGFEPSNKHEAGVLAQEVEAVLPEAVEIAPFDYDWKQPGKSKSGEKYLTVKYEKLVPLLIEGLKEQQARIDKLEKIIQERMK